MGVIATASSYSRTASIEHTEDKDITRANAELICRARYLLLRLLRDREQWKEERETLLQRIGKLKTELKRLQKVYQVPSDAGSVSKDGVPRDQPKRNRKNKKKKRKT